MNPTPGLYKQELGEVSGLTLWVVDGCLIRDEIDIEFTDGGQSIRQDYVPEDEIWVDDLSDPKDMACSVYQAIIERFLMSRGWSFDGARAWAGLEENQARMSPVEVRNRDEIVGVVDTWFNIEFLKHALPNKQRLAALSKCRRDYADPILCDEAPAGQVPFYTFFGSIDGYRLCEVDGAAVRYAYDVYFTQGGNPARYGYIPSGDIWVENLPTPKDQAATLYHELVETWLMTNCHWPYMAAHDEAVLAETEFRGVVSREDSNDAIFFLVGAWYNRWVSEHEGQMQRLARVNRIAARHLLRNAKDEASGKPFGYLMTLDLYDCRPGVCDDLDLCSQFLEALVTHLHMKQQSPPFIFHSDEKTYPDKTGLSGWVPLIESGIQIHTLRPKNFISVDVYSCGEFSADGVEDFVKAWFGPGKIEKAFIERGKSYNKEGSLSHAPLKDRTGVLLKPGDYISFQTYPRGTARGWVIINPRTRTVWRDEQGKEQSAPSLSAITEEGSIYGLPSPKGVAKMRSQVPMPKGLFQGKTAKYQDKKTIKTKDGDERTVYVYSERQVALRNREKAEHVEKLRHNIDDLRAQVRKDLKSDDDHLRNVALAVGLLDASYERVGNPESADKGHYGITGWKKKHLTFGDGKVTIRYVGKSGVKHEKVIDTLVSVKALREAVKGKGPEDEVVDCDASDVNDYLEPFDVSAKDLRGYHANTEMQTRLKAIRSKGGKLPDDKKEREKVLKDEFQQALEETAEAVGHEPATLRSQYLVPGLEDEFLKDGNVTEKLNKKGRIDRVASRYMKKAIIALVNATDGDDPDNMDMRNRLGLQSSLTLYEQAIVLDLEAHAEEGVRIKVKEVGDGEYQCILRGHPISPGAVRELLLSGYLERDDKTGDIGLSGLYEAKYNLYRYETTGGFQPPDEDGFTFRRDYMHGDSTKREGWFADLIGGKERKTAATNGLFETYGQFQIYYLPQYADAIPVLKKGLDLAVKAYARAGIRFTRKVNIKVMGRPFGSLRSFYTEADGGFIQFIPHNVLAKDSFHIFIHEFAHLYHNEYLPGGFSNPAIRAKFLEVKRDRNTGGSNYEQIQDRIKELDKALAREEKRALRPGVEFEEEDWENPFHVGGPKYTRRYRVVGWVKKDSVALEILNPSERDKQIYRPEQGRYIRHTPGRFYANKISPEYRKLRDEQDALYEQSNQIAMGKVPDTRYQDLRSEWIPTSYAKTNHKEWFAELLTTFVLHPEVLTPAVRDWLTSVIKHEPVKTASGGIKVSG